MIIKKVKMNSLNWQNKGEIISVNNRNIFVIDTININLNTIENQKKTLVILHGYPTSSFDYYKVLPELSKHYRVVIHDHLGFGFSDKPLKYSYSLIEQADIALQLWKQLSLTNVTLLAHDYGTSIATEILARQNKKQIEQKQHHTKNRKPVQTIPPRPRRHWHYGRRFKTLVGQYKRQRRSVFENRRCKQPRHKRHFRLCLGIKRH